MKRSLSYDDLECAGKRKRSNLRIENIKSIPLIHQYTIINYVHHHTLSVH